MNVVLRLMELMLSLCGGVVGWGGGCTVIFVSTPSPTDLDWTIRLDWSLTKILDNYLRLTWKTLLDYLRYLS